MESAYGTRRSPDRAVGYKSYVRICKQGTQLVLWFRYSREKAKKAIKAYGIQPPLITNEKVIGLIDTTAFGSAKDGILFGSKCGLYYKYDGHGLKGHIPYSELAFTPEDRIQCPLSIFREDMAGQVTICTVWRQTNC